MSVEHVVFGERSSDFWSICLSFALKVISLWPMADSKPNGFFELMRLDLFLVSMWRASGAGVGLWVRDASAAVVMLVSLWLAFGKLPDMRM